MKRIKLLLILVLGWLMLTGSSPEKKRVRKIDPNNKDVFIGGNLFFENQNLDTIKFWIEGDKGKYSLILFQEGKDTIDAHIIKNATIVSSIFKKDVCPSLSHSIFNGTRIDYFIIDFNDKELNGKNLFSLGEKVVKKIEEKTGGHLSGYIIIFKIKVVVKK